MMAHDPASGGGVQSPTRAAARTSIGAVSLLLIVFIDYQIDRLSVRRRYSIRPCGQFCLCGVRVDLSVRRRMDSSNNLDGRRPDPDGAAQLIIRLVAPPITILPGGQER